MTAAAAIALITGRFHGRDAWGSPAAAQAAPNKGSAAGGRDAIISLAKFEER